MPDLNALPVVASARQPRGAVKLNGNFVAWTEWQIENNVFRAADTFSVHIPSKGLSAPYDAAWLTSQTGLTVEIFANAAPSDPANYVPAAADRLIYGQTDDITFDPVQGVIELTGRDFTAKLIDTKTSENHQNQTSSAVATLLATREGLKPVVTATTTIIGTYYTQDHTDINQQQSEWELLTKLADFEGFDVFVSGDELHFQPKPTGSGSRYALVWTPPTDDTAHPNLNATTINLSRSLTIAKGVTVTVRSWNAKQKKAFTATWPRSAKPVRPGQSDAKNLAYNFTVPGLTQDQASLRAQRLYNQIVAHMVKMSADLPGDGILDCTKTIDIRGTGTTFDQVYYPDSVKRSMSLSEGYRMSVTAKNISSEIEAAAT